MIVLISNGDSKKNRPKKIKKLQIHPNLTLHALSSGQ